MSVLYEVIAKTGTYRDRDGNDKNRYVRMGVVLKTQGGAMMLKLESIPVGWDGAAFLNEPKAKDEQRTAPPQRQAPTPRPTASTGSGFDDMEDSIPF